MTVSTQFVLQMPFLSCQQRTLKPQPTGTECVGQWADLPSLRDTGGAKTPKLGHPTSGNRGRPRPADGDSQPSHGCLAQAAAAEDLEARFGTAAEPARPPTDRGPVVTREPETPAESPRRAFLVQIERIE